jgi:hypothetical protein
MSAKKDKALPGGNLTESKTEPVCFVVMPISDVEGYEPGHFGRVYEHIIKPACKIAGLQPIRADEVQVTNYIALDILRKILDADMVICDLSAKNPNVLYELGIRQAFNLPVTLIKDSKTSRIFDIQGLRDIEYDESLRIDKINDAVESIANTLKNTSTLDENEVNSLVQLLGVQSAKLPSIEISEDTSILLNAINDIGGRLSRLEEYTLQSPLQRGSRSRIFNPPVDSDRIDLFLTENGKLVSSGVRVSHKTLGEGVIKRIHRDILIVEFSDGRVFNFTGGSNGSAKQLEFLPNEH